ncbi:uncharacterized protein LOC111483428 isoform X2 [Cucurbita maxima]|uniref:Uncharacterized protein LOC111483428 isoform X2 n=1 Tax=Cucurbita maxima TaxID=3661 RepID=A0A6J1JB99_CUCMA|nr:uncharacterized protein LOC111483428 isoform X2 [Cucurbita maxima]
MAAKPLTTEAIAVTEKKMDMALDDIIKMSKITGNKARKERRFPNKMQKFPNNVTQDRPRKLQRFMDSRSSVRQGALAKRRSNFQGNQFALTTEVSRRAVVAPTRPRAFYRRAPNWNKTRVDAPPVPRKPFNNRTFVPKVAAPAQPQTNATQRQRPQTNATQRQRPQTLDSLFANMKEQRLRVLSQRQNGAAQQRNGGRQQIPPWQRGRFGN